MKILMVTMSMGIGGAETHIAELCRELKKRGYSVTLASNGGVYADMLQNEGIEHITLPLHSKNPKSVFISYNGLYKAIANGGYDIVHAHARIPAFIIGLVRKRLAFRFVTTAHLDFAVNPLWRLLSDWGDRTMAVSEDIADYLVKGYGCSRTNISVTINGIDTEKYSDSIDCKDVIENFGLKSDSRKLVYMSRLDADRSDPAFRIINIAKKLNTAVENLEIIIVGGGGDFDRLKSMSDKVNNDVGRRLITMTGPRSDTEKFIALADVFVGVSRSALEAMSASKPVILAGNQGAMGIFDENCLAGAMENNFCCRGYDTADEKKLYDDIVTLFSLPEDELKAKGAYCREVVEKYYTVRKMVDDYEGLYERSMSSPAPYFGHCDVLLSGYYGFGNIGDETLLSVISSELAATHSEIHIAALTRHPKADSSSNGIRCINRYNFLSIYSELRHAKLLISGGGTLFQDSTSSRSLQYYAWITQIAKKQGVKVYIYANGIGPINEARNRRLTAQCVSSADAVSVRDPDSKTELVSYGVSEDKIMVTADPAFLVVPYSGKSLDRLMADKGLDGKRFFCVSVRRCEGRLNTMIDETLLVNEVSTACVYIMERYSLTPVLMPMQAANDTGICTLIRDEIRMRTMKKDAVLVEPDSAEEIIGILSKSEFAIGMRLHMLIFGARAGVPVIGISYDPKIDSVMKRLNLPYLVNVINLKSDYLTDAADEIMDSRESLCSEIQSRAEEMAQLSRGDVDRAVGMVME